jgi:ADP-ribosylglycohydrolase
MSRRPEVFRRVSVPLPEITESAREYARSHPDSWMYYRDSTLPAEAPMIQENVIGGRHIDESGEFDGIWVNPAFLPQPDFAKVDFQSYFDLHVWRLLRGFLSVGEFVVQWDRCTVLVEVEPAGGHDFRIVPRESGPPVLSIYTSAQFVPDGVSVREVGGAQFIGLCGSREITLDFNPGSEVLALEWLLSELRDCRGDMERLMAEHPGTENPLTVPERLKGSILAGAVGDALGYAIEFSDIDAIRRHHGDRGVAGPVVGRDGVAQISDDTQMMLFTVEGLIRAHIARRINPKDNNPVPEVQHAYQRWFHTQNQPWERAGGPYAQRLPQPDGWLISHRALFAARAPGSTCMSALAQFAQSHRHASPQYPINDSKGCGGVMRAGPVALWSPDPAEVFLAAASTAALTHGHPSGFLSAGVLAVIVRQLLQKASLADSVRMARDLLIRWPGHEEQLRLLDTAVELGAHAPLSPEEINSRLGQGWVGEEALAIGLYSVLVTDNVRSALLLSVNHSGDSDSTGIVCGSIAGAVYGTRGIPTEWLAVLELHDIVTALADDAVTEFSPDPPTDPEWTRRYPAW